jgi:penicillin-binding protein 2
MNMGSSLADSAGQPGGARNYRIVVVVVVLAFLALAVRLWYLQVLRGDHYYRKSADNFVKEVVLPATRGQVLDAKGRILVDNRPSYTVYVTPAFLTEESLAYLTQLLHLDADKVAALRAKVDAKKGRDRFRQLIAISDVSRNDMAAIDSHRLELSGVTVDAEAHRFYPYGKVAAHVLGYMNEVAAEELPKLREQGYRISDYIGRAGIERQWESYLRGKDGLERIFVDAKGYTKSDVDAEEIESFAQLYGGPRRVEPEAGDNVILTLDVDLQKVVEKALAKHRSGAAAVVDVNTGRVLALASHPSFDPNVLTGRLTRAEDERLQKDPYRPLIDKALRENYFPGSTFKIIPSLAGLDDKQVTPDEKMPCRPYKLPGHTFHCMEEHGPAVDLYKAMVESCDIFFYHLGERIGLDRMARLANDFGFGAPTGIGLAGEAPGFIATTDYYKHNGGFRIGYTLNTAIGQGSTKVTVLQLALAYAAVGNGGDLYTPELVSRIVTPSGQVVQEFPPRLRHKVEVSPDALARVRASLCGVVNDAKGTAASVRDPDLPPVCGKTGTAQVISTRRSNDSVGWDTNNAHGWFASFAPADKPEIAVVVLIEHGGVGGHVAAPVAMEIYRGYFANRLPATANAEGAK